MFGKLKEALKKSISIFSRKATAEAVRPPTTEPTTIPAQATTQETKSVPQPRAEPKTKTEKSAKDSKKRESAAKTSERPGPHTTPKKTPGQPDTQTTPQKTPEPTSLPFATPPQVETPAQKSFLNRILLRKPKVQEQNETAKSVPEKKGIFTKAKELITTTTMSEEKFDELFWDMELVLMENNVAVDVVHKLKADLKSQLLDRPLPRDLESTIRKTLQSSIEQTLSRETPALMQKVKSKAPFIIAFFGINGSGKTTTIAKIAKLLRDNSLSCVMAAGDTFRAAAIHQLEEHANKLNVRIIKHDYGADAAAVAFDAVKYAQKNGIDVVLIDTAGRLHSDTNLMDELKKIVRVAKPDLKIFVGESITGNDCIEQSRQFDEMIGIDSIILTKADVDEKGGTALSMSYVTGKPIIYIGLGQGYDDLKPFTKETVINSLGLA